MHVQSAAFGAHPDQLGRGPDAACARLLQSVFPSWDELAQQVCEHKLVFQVRPWAALYPKGVREQDAPQDATQSGVPAWAFQASAAQVVRAWAVPGVPERRAAREIWMVELRAGGWRPASAARVDLHELQEAVDSN